MKQKDDKAGLCSNMADNYSLIKLIKLVLAKSNSHLDSHTTNELIGDSFEHHLKDTKSAKKFIKAKREYFKQIKLIAEESIKFIQNELNKDLK